MTEAKISPKKIPIEDWVKAVKKIEVPDLKDDEKKIFDAVKAHKNIPKTSSKFNNFCIHNLKVKNEKLINKMWTHLSSALEKQSGPAKESIETKKAKLDKKLAPKKSEAKSDVKKVSFSNNGSPDESRASKKAGSKAKVHEPTPRKLPDAKAAKLEAIKAAKKQKKQKIQQKKEDNDSDDAVDEEPVAKKSIAKNGLQKGTKGPQKAAVPVKGALKSALKKDDQTNNSKVNSQKNKKNQMAKKEAAPTKNGLSEVSKKKAEAKTKGAKPALKTTGKNPKFDPKKKKQVEEDDDDDDEDDDDDDDDDLDLDSDDDIDFSDSDAISMDDEAMDSVSSGSEENEDEESDDDELLSFDEDDSLDESEEEDEDE